MTSPDPEMDPSEKATGTWPVAKWKGFEVKKADLVAGKNAEEVVRSITQLLEEEIVFCQLQPRQRLVEDEIAERFGIKRYLARQAIIELERLGLVERIRNRGAMVRLYSPREVNDIHAVRELLEVKAAELIPFPLDANALAELEALQARHAEGIVERDKRKVFYANIAFHRELFRHCANEALIEAIEIFAQKSHAYRSIFTSELEALQWAADEHRAMVEACRAGDRERLVTLCRDHLTPAKNRYIATWQSRFD